VKIIEDQEVKKKRPKGQVDEYLVFDGKHEGIVSKELFDKAQQILGTKHRTRTDQTLKNPFSGVMFCKCGHRIGYNTFVRDGKEYAEPKLVCNDQVHCHTGSANYREVLDYICRSLEDCISDFEMRINNNQETSVKLHKELVSNLENKLKALEKKEEMQWEAQYDPDPDMRMPDDVFKRLNEKIRIEKEELKKALCKAYESMPQPVDYQDRIVKFTDALDALKNPDVPADVKNQYLKDIIERMEYDRPPIVRITKENEHLYNVPKQKGARYYKEPFTITMTIRP
jgi:hypothetical protein